MDLEYLAEVLAENVASWETSVLQRIGRNISKCNKLTLEDLKSINNIYIS